MANKVENFNRISEARLKKITHLLKQMSNLSNSSYYEYSVEDVNRIINTIQNELNDTKSKLMNSNAMKIEAVDCPYKSLLEYYLKYYPEFGDAFISKSLVMVFNEINWRVYKNKTMQNTFELIEFAFTYCEGLDLNNIYAHYVYKRLSSLESNLISKYIEDDSDLMKKVKNGIDRIVRIRSLSMEAFFANPQNALDVYTIILECFEAIKDRDYIYRLLIGMVETQIWKRSEGMDQEYYTILEKTVSAWE